MYKTLLFNGGVYKFEDLVEYIEDIGGLVVKEDRLHITRGSYFISEEIRVMLIVPTSEFSGVKSVVDDIKGNVEELVLEEELYIKLINALKIYNVLCKSDKCLTKPDILHLINSKDIDYIKISNETSIPGKKLDDTLELMISLELIDKNENAGIIEYCIPIN